MNKPVFGMLLGGLLGIFDGLSALFYPETAPMIQGIVIGSTIKGVITGVAIGFFSRKVRSIPLGILFGLGVGLFLAYLVAAMPDPSLKRRYYFEIMVPGGILGVIVGWPPRSFHLERQHKNCEFASRGSTPSACRGGSWIVDRRTGFQDPRSTIHDPSSAYFFFLGFGFAFGLALALAFGFGFGFGFGLALAFGLGLGLGVPGTTCVTTSGRGGYSSGATSATTSGWTSGRGRSGASATSGTTSGRTSG